MKTTTSEISKPYIYINTNGSLSHKLNKRVEGSIKNIGHIENESDKLNEKNERMIEEDKTSNESYQQNFNTNANSIPIVVNSTNSHSNCIKDKSHLLKLIKYRIAQINRLDESGNIETSKTLAKTVETLPRRLLLGGMVIDPLIEEKYFISTGCLKGGGARPKGRNYIVCCGFNNGYSTGNSAGIEIRAEDGVVDDRGCITDHGIDPTGNVSDVHVLMTKTDHACQNDLFHEFHESCRLFKVYCRFTSKWLADFEFIIISNHVSSN
ncbi:unnamed protein product [Rotaria socialis]|uniref:Uncharacterized protein n=1 Tax=Rotaria socialis TaxID=392032 RepID=A0A820ET80_9BILA|nr:unnamed protein product [Rotaria socialis]